MDPFGDLVGYGVALWFPGRYRCIFCQNYCNGILCDSCSPTQKGTRGDQRWNSHYKCRICSAWKPWKMYRNNQRTRKDLSMVACKDCLNEIPYSDISEIDYDNTYECSRCEIERDARDYSDMQLRRKDKTLIVCEPCFDDYDKHSPIKCSKCAEIREVEDYDTTQLRRKNRAKVICQMCLSDKLPKSKRDEEGRMKQKNNIEKFPLTGSINGILLLNLNLEFVMKRPDFHLIDLNVRPTDPERDVVFVKCRSKLMKGFTCVYIEISQNERQKAHRKYLKKNKGKITRSQEHALRGFDDNLMIQFHKQTGNHLQSGDHFRDWKHLSDIFRGIKISCVVVPRGAIQETITVSNIVLYNRFQSESRKLNKNILFTFLIKTYTKQDGSRKY